MTEMNFSLSGPQVRQPRSLTIFNRQIGDLKLDPTNARRHSKQQIRQLAQRIKTFGFNIPIVVDANLKVIAGHGRVAACQQLGWAEVPTICLDHLTAGEARAFAIADNRLAHARAQERWSAF